MDVVLAWHPDRLYRRIRDLEAGRGPPRACGWCSYRPGSPANAWGYPYCAMVSGASLVMPDRFLQAEPLATMIASLQPGGVGARYATAPGWHRERGGKKIRRFRAPAWEPGRTARAQQQAQARARRAPKR